MDKIEEFNIQQEMYNETPDFTEEIFSKRPFQTPMFKIEEHLPKHPLPIEELAQQSIQQECFQGPSTSSSSFMNSNFFQRSQENNFMSLTKTPSTDISSTDLKYLKQITKREVRRKHSILLTKLTKNKDELIKTNYKIQHELEKQKAEQIYHPDAAIISQGTIDSLKFHEAELSQFRNNLIEAEQALRAQIEIYDKERDDDEIEQNLKSFRGAEVQLADFTISFVDHLTIPAERFLKLYRKKESFRTTAKNKLLFKIDKVTVHVQQAQDALQKAQQTSTLFQNGQHDPALSPIEFQLSKYTEQRRSYINQIMKL